METVINLGQKNLIKTLINNTNNITLLSLHMIFSQCVKEYNFHPAGLIFLNFFITLLKSHSKACLTLPESMTRI